MQDLFKMYSPAMDDSITVELSPIKQTLGLREGGHLMEAGLSIEVCHSIIFSRNITFLVETIA